MNFDQAMSDIMDDPNAIIYIHDKEGRYVYVNDNYAQLLPFSRDQVLGKTNAELYGEKAARNWDMTDALTLASNSYTIIEENLFDKRIKKWRKFLSTKALITDDEGKQYLAGISVEVRDTNSLEYERRLAQFRARFLEALYSS